MKSFQYFLLASFFVFIINCSLIQTPPAPFVVLQNNSCSPPCWNGIVPGQTTLADAREFLGSFPSVDIGSVRDWTTLLPNDTIDFHFISGMSEVGGRMISVDGVIQYMSFGPKGISTSQIHEFLSLPNKYISVYNAGAEQPYFYTFYIYDSGIVYTTKRRGLISNEGVQTLNEDLRVEGFLFCNPAKVIEGLENGIISNFSKGELDSWLRPWDESADFMYMTR